MDWASVSDLQALGTSVCERYAAALPYPHAVFDDFFNSELLGQIAKEFPDLSRDSRSIGYDDPNQIKFASRGDAQFPPLTRQLMSYLNSPPFLEFLATLTGIQNLIADAQFEGGGLHEIRRGGFLKVHADFDRHRVTGHYRRLNALLYLNQDWQESYGGKLELWSRDMQSCVKEIAPLFNRLVVFTTDDTSYHGHPDPLECPKHRGRRSLALYYYTEQRPEIAQETAPPSGHSTLFRDRPGSDDATRPYRPRFQTRLRRAWRKVRDIARG
jgi:hypothetical protein